MSELLRKAVEKARILRARPHLKPVAAGGGELSKAERWRTAQMAQDWLNANADPKYHRRRLPDMEENGQFKLLTRGRLGMRLKEFRYYQPPGGYYGNPYDKDFVQERQKERRNGLIKAGIVGAGLLGGGALLGRGLYKVGKSGAVRRADDLAEELTKLRATKAAADVPQVAPAPRGRPPKTQNNTPPPAPPQTPAPTPPQTPPSAPPTGKKPQSKVVENLNQQGDLPAGAAAAEIDEITAATGDAAKPARKLTKRQQQLANRKVRAAKFAAAQSTPAPAAPAVAPTKAPAAAKTPAAPKTPTKKPQTPPAKPVASATNEEFWESGGKKIPLTGTAAERAALRGELDKVSASDGFKGQVVGDVVDAARARATASLNPKSDFPEGLSDKLRAAGKENNPKPNAKKNSRKKNDEVDDSDPGASDEEADWEQSLTGGESEGKKPTAKKPAAKAAAKTATKPAAKSKKGKKEAAPLSFADRTAAKVKASRDKKKGKKSKNLSALLSRVRYFNQFQTDEAGIPLTGRVARDRFVKKLRDEDLDRRDANILRAGGAGALAGLLARGRIGASKRALIGAGAGGLGVIGIRALTNNDRDIYGERDRGSKRAELLPAVGGLGAAAWLAGKRLKAFAKKIDHRGHREHGGGLKEFVRGDYAIPAMRKILDAKRKSQPTQFWPSTLEGMQPHYRNRYAMPPDGTFVPSLKFSGKDPLWSKRKVTEKNSAGFVTKLQPGVAEGDDFRLRSGLATGEHANNRKWAANFIRQARKDHILAARLRGVKEFGSMGAGRLYRQKAALLKRGLFIEKRNPVTGELLYTEARPLVSDRDRYAGIYHRLAKKGAGSPNLPPWKQDVAVGAKLQSPYDGKMQHALRYDDVMQKHERKMRGFSSRLRGVKEFGSSGLGRLYRKKASLLKKGVFIERRNPDAPVLQPGAIWPGSFIETPSFVARGNVNMKTGQVYSNQMLPSDQQKHAGIYHRIASKGKPRFIDGIEVPEHSVPGEFTGKFRQRKIHDDWLYRHDKKMRGFSSRLRGMKEFARGKYAIPALGKMLKDQSLMEEFMSGQRGPKLGDLDITKDLKIKLAGNPKLARSMAKKNIYLGPGRLTHVNTEARNWAADALRRGRNGDQILTPENHYRIVRGYSPTKGNVNLRNPKSFIVWPPRNLESTDLSYRLRGMKELGRGFYSAKLLPSERWVKRADPRGWVQSEVLPAPDKHSAYSKYVADKMRAMRRLNSGNIPYTQRAKKPAEWLSGAQAQLPSYYFSSRLRGVKEFGSMSHARLVRKLKGHLSRADDHLLVSEMPNAQGFPGVRVSSERPSYAGWAAKENNLLKKLRYKDTSSALRRGRHGRGLGIGVYYDFSSRLRGVKNFDDYRLYYFKGRNTGIAARSAEEARSKKKRGGDELVAVRTPSDSEKSQMARGVWVRTRRDGKSPGQSRYGKGRGQGPARKSLSAKLRGLNEFAWISVKTDRVSADHAAARRAIIEKYGKPEARDPWRHRVRSGHEGIAVEKRDGPSIFASMNNPDSPWYVAPEKREEHRLRAKEWHRVNRLRHLASLKESNLASRLRAIKFFENREKRGMNPYVGAALSGFGSGAALGSLALLRRGATFRGAAKTAAKLGLASAGIVGGGALLGSKIVGDPRKEESAPFMKRAAIGGTLVGAGAGFGGALLLRKTKGGARALVAASKKSEPFSRPAMWLRKSPLLGATGIGAVGGALYGGGMGLDEGQQVDSIRNIKKDLKKNLSARLRLRLFGRGDQARWDARRGGGVGSNEDSQFANTAWGWATDRPMYVAKRDDTGRVVRDKNGDAIRVNWDPSSGQLWNSIAREAKNKRVTVQRGGRLSRDLVDELRGAPRQRDASGRIKKREWEKSWFHNKATEIGMTAAGLGGLATVRYANNNPDTKIGQAYSNTKKSIRATKDGLADIGKNILTGITKVTAKKAFSAKLKRLRELDAMAEYVGWDMRDPRGKSVRVFAPGSRKRERRQKEWHEKTENERKLWKAGIAAGVLGGVGVTLVGQRLVSGKSLIPSRFLKKKPIDPSGFAPSVKEADEFLNKFKKIDENK